MMMFVLHSRRCRHRASSVPVPLATSTMATITARVDERLPECVSEFGRHDVVEHRVDGCAQVVGHARDVVQYVGGDEQGIARRLLHVGGHQALGVEWRPANHERHHHSNWNDKSETLTLI